MHRAMRGPTAPGARGPVRVARTRAELPVPADPRRAARGLPEARLRARPEAPRVRRAPAGRRPLERAARRARRNQAVASCKEVAPVAYLPRPRITTAALAVSGRSRWRSSGLREGGGASNSV